LKGEGDCNFVKLLDFGLAKGQFQSRITETGTVLGTLNYMAPEQIALGEFSPASDIYSLGVIFYETVTTQLPFPGERVGDIMRQIMNKTPTEPIRLRLDLPIELNQVNHGDDGKRERIPADSDRGDGRAEKKYQGNRKGKRSL